MKTNQSIPPRFQSLLPVAMAMIVVLFAICPGRSGAQSFSDQFDAIDLASVWTQVDQGEISASGGILSMKDCNIYAGDITWTNYVMEFRARAPVTASEVRIFASFRYNSDKSRYVFGLRGGNNNDLYLARIGIDNDCAILKIEPLDFIPQKGVWYKIRIEVASSGIQVFLDDEVTPRLTATGSGAPFSAGKIGLGGGWSDVDFDYVTVSPVSGYEPSGSAMKFNFQPQTAPTVSGWTPLYKNNSGWLDGGMFDRDRNKTDDQLFDTLVGFRSMGAVKRFERSFANGDYIVSAHMGDAQYNSQNKLYFMDETVPTLDNKTSSGQSALIRRSITITGGKLNLKFEQTDDSCGVSINWLTVDPRAAVDEEFWDLYDITPVDDLAIKEAQRRIERAAHTNAVITDIGNGRSEYSLNGDWLFLPDYETSTNEVQHALPDADWHVIDVPNMWTPIYNWTYMDNDQGRGSANWMELEMARCENYTFDYATTLLGYYKHCFNLPSEIAGKTVKINFEAIAKSSQVWINGNLVAVHQGMFAPINVDITPWVVPGDNYVVVQAGDGTEFSSGDTNVQGVAVSVEITGDMLNSIPHGMYFGKNRGIWQDVSLIISDPLTIEDTFFKPQTNHFDLDVTLKNQSASSISYNVAAQIRDHDSNKLVYDHLSSSRSGALSTDAGNEYNGTLSSDDSMHATFETWMPEFPNLYTADIFAYNYNIDGSVNLTSFNGNAIKINFQGLADPTVSGWTPVDGSVYSGSGTGWSEAISTEDRDVSGDQLFDTMVLPNPDSEAVFTYDLPNGDYVITLQFGDPSYPTLAEAYIGNGVNTIDKAIVRDFKNTGESVVVLKSLTVSDGKLEITIPRLPGEGRGTAVNWLVIESRGDVSTAKWELGINHFNVLDNVSYNAGFRTFTVSGDDFLLNGYPYKIRGANHNPNIIRPNDAALADWFMKKVHDKNINFTRSHGSPMNDIWLDAADEQGVAISQEGIWPWLMHGGLVEDIPDEELLTIWINEWTALIDKYKNHPSILMWTMNNESKLYLEHQPESWRILSDAIATVRATDPTRPVCADSGYCRDSVSNKGGVYPGIDDGDIDDKHCYNNWYDNDTFYALRDGVTFTDKRTAGRPYISQEFSTGYPDADTGHAIKHYVYTHMTPQALVGKWGYEQNDPKYFLKRHALTSKESCEAIRTSYRDTSAGVMIFALCTWFQNLYDVNTINPYPTLDAVAQAWEPVMVSAKLMGRHFYAGSTHTVNSVVVNDSPIRETLENIRVDWDICFSNTVLRSGTHSYGGSLAYYNNMSEPFTFDMPATLPEPKIEAKLLLKLHANGRAISTNSYDITICENTFVHNASGVRVGYYTQADKLSGIFSDLGVTVVPVTDLGSLNANDYDVLVVANLSSTPANYNNIINFANSGGRVLLSMNENHAVNLLPAELRGSTTESKEIVTPCAYEKKIFEGIEPDALSWFTGTETASDSPKVGYTPIACNRAYNVNVLSNVTLLAETTLIHGYYDGGTDTYHPAKTFDQVHGYPLVEIQKGAGRIIVSSMYVQTDADPVANRLLANILTYLVDNGPPIITSTPAVVLPLGTPYSYALTAEDNEGDLLSYSAPVMPTWLNFNTNTAVLSGTPSAVHLGLHNVTLNVNDGQNGVDQNFTIEVVSTATSSVPNVVGLSETAAEISIINAGYSVGAVILISNGTEPAGTVISQNPAGGTAALLGSSIGLVISSGPAPGQVILGVDFHQGPGDTIPVTPDYFAGWFVGNVSAGVAAPTTNVNGYFVTVCSGAAIDCLTTPALQTGMNARNRTTGYIPNAGDFTQADMMRERIASLVNATDPETGSGTGNGLYLKVSGLAVNTPYQIRAWGGDFTGTNPSAALKNGYVYGYDATGEQAGYASLPQLGSYTVAGSPTTIADNEKYSIHGTITTDSSGTLIYKQISNIDKSVINGFILSEVVAATGYNAWIDTFPSAVQTGMLDDDDADLRNNFYEYVLNGDPTNRLNSGIDPILGNDGATLLYIYLRRNDDSNLVYQIETSTNLVPNVWTNTGYSVLGTNVNVGGTCFDEVTNLISTGVSEQFIRLNVSER